MKIVVIGGKGLIGTKLVSQLQSLGHNVVAASPSTGVNVLTGEGLDEALKDAEVVVDLANSPSFEDKAVLNFFETSGKNLLAAEEAAGVRHHIALSIVGVDLLDDCGYFLAKVAQEKIIRKSKVPYTIVRSTQFFEFLKSITQSDRADKTVHLSPAFIQPIASDDVAEALLDVVLSKPRNGIIEIAGPERVGLSELGKRYLNKIQDKAVVVADPEARYFGGRLDEYTLVPRGEARLGKKNFVEWFKTQ